MSSDLAYSFDRKRLRSGLAIGLFAAVVGIWMLATGSPSSFFSNLALNRSIGGVVTLIASYLVLLHARWMLRAWRGESALTADRSGLVTRVTGWRVRVASADEITDISTGYHRVKVDRASGKSLYIPTGTLSPGHSDDEVAEALREAVGSDNPQ